MRLLRIHYAIFVVILLISCAIKTDVATKEFRFDDDKLSIEDAIHWSYTNFENDSIRIELNNVSLDTLYLFSSYLSKNKYWATCLQRVNEVEKQFRVSFLPIVPFLGVNSPDRIILAPESICHPFQTTYEFIPLAPKGVYDMTLVLDKLWSSPLNSKDNYVDVSIYELSKSEQDFQFKKRRFKSNLECYDMNVEFAFYSNISFHNNKDMYYMKEAEFDVRSKSFDIVRVELGNGLYPR